MTFATHCRLAAAATFATIAIALFSFATLARAEAPGGSAQLEVQNLRSGQGPLMLAAYGDAASFRKNPSSQLQVAVTGETMQLQVCGLAGNAVAMTLFQDLNANGKLDANAFGMPTEPWGASGKSAPMTSPSWDSAQVALDGSPIVVKLSK